MEEDLSLHGKKLVSTLAVVAIVLGACSSGSTPAPTVAPASAAAASVAPASAAPASAAPTDSAAATKPLIAFSQEGMENSWRTENTNSILSEAAAYGYEIIWQQADGDQLKQNSQVQNLLERKPAVLIVEPAEQQAATPIKGLADAANIPMIVADRAIGGEPGTGMFKTLITVNWEKVGVALGEAAVATLKAKWGKEEGSIVEIAGTIGSSPQIGMDAGFKSVISKYPGIKIVAVQDGKNERAPGLQVMEDFLTRFPKGQIQLVWGQNDEMGIGALKAIQAAGRDELLGAIITKDGSIAGIEQLAAGNFSTVCSNSPYFGPIIMPYVKQILAGEAIPATPDKPFTCFENLTDQGKADVKALYDDMVATKKTFAPR